MIPSQPDDPAACPLSDCPRCQEEWYHGSPLRIDILLSGSTITRQRHLAEVFAVKPTLVCIEDDGSLRHNGHQSGWLYRLAAPLNPADLVPHPRSSMPPGFEWLTTRPLPLACIAPVTPLPGEQLDAQQVAELLAQWVQPKDGA